MENRKEFYQDPKNRNYNTNDSLREILDNSHKKGGERIANKGIIKFEVDKAFVEQKKETAKWLRKKGVQFTNWQPENFYENKADQIAAKNISDTKPPRLVVPDDVNELPSDELAAELLDKHEENLDKPPIHQHSRN